MDDIGPIPEKTSPLKPIISWYNQARARVKAPNYQIEAHILGISLPNIQNISNVNQFEDSELELLDKYQINLPIAAFISKARGQMDHEEWKILLSEDYISKLSKSDSPLHDIWLSIKGNDIHWNDVFEVFLQEGYCGHMYQYRQKKSSSKSGFETHLLRTLKRIANGKPYTKKDVNTIMQAYNQEKDSGNYDWFAPRFKEKCPNSVKILASWEGL